MFQQGTVKTYNEQRGFGFIKVEGENQDLFFHISNFPNKNIPPNIGEKLKFRKVKDNGKYQADQIVRLDIEYQQPKSTVIGQREQFQTQAAPRYEKAKTSIKSKVVTVIGLMIVLVLAVMVYSKYQEYKTQKQQQIEQLVLEQERIVAEQRAALGDVDNIGLSEQGRKNLEASTSTPIRTNTSSTSVSSPYQCDGRQHCSQMNSRAEADWYIRNCPNTKMDGDGDGVPCENDSRW